VTRAEGCRLCGLPSEDKQSVDILVNDLWHVYAPWEITPGGFIVQTRRHVEGLWLLDRGESETLGVVLRDISDAIREIYSAEKVYVISLGENYPHFHLMLLPRAAGVPADGRGLVLLKSYLQGTNEAASDRSLVHRVAALTLARATSNGASAAMPLAQETVSQG
jgi:hypothetical protein